MPRTCMPGLKCSCQASAGGGTIRLAGSRSQAVTSPWQPASIPISRPRWRDGIPVEQGRGWKLRCAYRWTMPAKRVAVLAPVAWRTPPRQYGAWETVAGNIAEGLVARGWDVTLFATGDSVTAGHLHAVVDKGYEEDSAADPKVAEYLHISEVFEHAAEFD